MTSNKEKVSSKEVGLEIGLVISRFLYKTEHLHYGFWPEDLEIIPENVQEAQDLHSKLIIDAIPDNVETILDVGSGSGDWLKNYLMKATKFIVYHQVSILLMQLRKNWEVRSRYIDLRVRTFNSNNNMI